MAPLTVVTWCWFRIAVGLLGAAAFLDSTPAISHDGLTSTPRERGLTLQAAGQRVLRLGSNASAGLASQRSWRPGGPEVWIITLPLQYRADPEEHQPALGTLPPGLLIEVREITPGWAAFQAETGTIGYVRMENLRQ